MNVLAIIPARGGSKRLPGKNLEKVGERSLVQWAVEHAMSCGDVTDVVVSTDSDAIAEDARSGSYSGAIVEEVNRSLGIITMGSMTPDILMRPAHLATDDASSWDVVAHALEHYPEAEVFVLLQPTSPLRRPEDISRCIRWTDDGRMVATRSDVLPGGCVDIMPNGAVFAQRTASFMNVQMLREEEGTHWQHDPQCRVAMPRRLSIDINTAEDLEEARRIWNDMRQNGTHHGG